MYADRSHQQDEQCLPDYFHELMKAGNAFVKALAETTSMDHAKVEKLLRKKRFHGSLQSVSELNEDETEKETLHVVNEDEKDDFLASLEDLSHNKELPKAGVTESYMSKKNWKDQIKRAQMDYSEFFPVNVGMKEGIEVFRMEKLKPELVHKDSGKLSDGDAYVVRHTFSNSKGRLEHQIYQYVGEKASLDKKATSAFYSVGLRALLGATLEIKREESYNVSKDFQNAFFAQGKDFQITDASHAVKSGFMKFKSINTGFLCIVPGQGNRIEEP